MDAGLAAGRGRDDGSVSLCGGLMEDVVHSIVARPAISRECPLCGWSPALSYSRARPRGVPAEAINVGWPSTPAGIYFITRRDSRRDHDVIYVGQSVNLQSRLREHVRSAFIPTGADAWAIPIAPRDALDDRASFSAGLDLLERFWIRRLDPPKNYSHTKRSRNGDVS